MKNLENTLDFLEILVGSFFIWGKKRIKECRNAESFDMNMEDLCSFKNLWR